jgi:two-component system NtrC family sensor kinase
VALIVTDTGVGMDESVRARIFEPFFTTKEVGEGTGLGLSISLGIARAHGGLLELCDPKEGTGACFRLSLPAATPAADSTGRLPAAGRTAVEASRRALVVEDEAPIRQLIVRLLQRRGFAVVEAPSRAAAREAVAGGPFDVVLCDLRLADGSGTAAVEEMRSVRPDITRRVIFVTGDAGALSGADPEIADLPVLPKPFTSEDLDRALGSLMASA